MPQRSKKSKNLIAGILALSIVGSAEAGEQKSIYAAPLKFGPKVKIQACFGENVWVKFSVIESNVNAPVVYKTYSTGNKKWLHTNPGQIIRGQEVWISAKSTGTGGYLKLLIEGACIK